MDKCILSYPTYKRVMAGEIRCPSCIRFHPTETQIELPKVKEIRISRVQMMQTKLSLIEMAAELGFPTKGKFFVIPDMDRIAWYETTFEPMQDFVVRFERRES